MYLAIMCESGRERKLVEAFASVYGTYYQDSIKLHIFERVVQKIDATGKRSTTKENIMPGYIVAEVRPENTEAAYHIFKSLKYVRKVLLPGEVTQEEYNHLVQLIDDAKVQIAEPELFYEKDLLEAEKEIMHVWNYEAKAQLLARIEVLKEQKRRYLQYLRNLPQIISFRLIKGKRAVYEFSLELLQVLEVRDNLNQHAGGRGDPVALAVRLAQASLSG